MRCIFTTKNLVLNFKDTIKKVKTTLTGRSMYKSCHNIQNKQRF